MLVDYIFTDELRRMGFGHIGENVSISANCHIPNKANVFISDNSRIHPYCSVVAYPSSKVVIGEHVHVGSHSLIFAYRDITIGSFCSFSSHIRMFSGSEDFSGESLLGFQIPDTYRNVFEGPISIGSNCGMGSGVLLLPDTHLSDGTVVGANSSMKSITTEPWSIYAGNPARFLKKRSMRGDELKGDFLGLRDRKQ